MRKTLLFTMLLGTIISSKAQTTIFEDSFETYTDFATSGVGNWTLRDIDGATNNYTIENYTFPNQGTIPSFILFNPNGTTPSLGASPEATAKTGNKYMASFASFNVNANNAAVPVTQSDWLISPQITLGTSGNVVKFWAKSYTTQYGNERFKVLISGTNTEVASFTALSTGNYVQASSTTWTEYTYNIPVTYNSQNVYIAVQCVSNDSFIFMVDDFKVTTTGTVSNDQFFKENFNIYPNPTSDILNITAINGLEFQDVSIVDLTGRKIKSVSNSTSINVSDLASGTYIINIQTSEGKATSKFIKK